MITLPSGSILVQRVINNDFIDTKLESDLIPVSVTGINYITAGISGSNLQELLDDIVITLATSGNLTAYSGYAETNFVTVTGTQNVTGAKTFTNTLTFSGNVLPATSGTLNIGSDTLATASVFTRNVSSDVGQSLTLKTGSAGALWVISTDSIGVKSSLSSSNQVGVIGLNTTDGSDNGRLELRGYSADGFPSPSTRGGAIYLNGNENSGTVGILAGSSGNIEFSTDNTERWRIATNGTLINPQSGISAIQWSAASSVGRILGATNNTGRLQIASASLPDNTLGPYIDMNAATGDCSIVGKTGFGVVLNTAGGNTLTANSNGTVSINTTNNSDVLNVQTNSPDQGITIDGFGSGTRAQLTLKSTGTTQAWISCDNGAFATGYNGALICASTSAIVLFSNGASRWVVDPSGNVLPYANTTYDIGSGSNACRIVHTRNLISDTGQNLGIEGKSEIYFYTGGSSSIRWAFSSAGHFVPILNQGYNIGVGGSNAVGSIFAVNYFGPSDINRKRDISSSDYGLNVLKQITPIKYKYKKFKLKTVDNKQVEDLEDEDTQGVSNKPLQLGLSAQEVKNLIPEAVVGDEEDFSLSIDYTKLIPVLIKAIQELDCEHKPVFPCHSGYSPVLNDIVTLNSELKIIASTEAQSTTSLGLVGEILGVMPSGTTIVDAFNNSYIYNGVVSYNLCSLNLNGIVNNIKVSSEGGNIVEGDLLCTSSVSGCLMRQSTDSVKSYSIARALVPVTFSGGVTVISGVTAKMFN